jgi:hypothetical protein
VTTALQRASLRAASREQNLDGLVDRLRSIVPDIRRQYSSFDVDSEYLTLKVRIQHAFQCSLALEAVRAFSDDRETLVLVDIGDSAGTHLRCIQSLLPDRSLRCLGINSDPLAIERIRAQGLEGMLARAEDLAAHHVRADILLSYETLEHLSDPICVLRSLSYQTTCRALVLTVLYLRNSRVGLHQIRHGLAGSYNSENTHILELSPDDWRLVLAHSGWKVAFSRTYLQYPKRHWLRLTRRLWRQLDFEGFWGAVVVPDHEWSDRYVDAPGPSPGSDSSTSPTGRAFLDVD